ncbi:phosphoenolpyruvate--protein phosphotransferase [Shewanella schlegeliana]|uniref:phosphoenolpyruvate--protein phosphotransferase n=1 Tax=Shewanella schlegeliana TaxID=190308 RepID=A0ABS1SUJ3_9GAMM|nr:phosphoenolpyruvate--protein phosphotransferase [Shewanella schlegeliana]MBL4912198.1 phosphoenolpyruvate--protein phosphotransferase [Shewanella schlegeliana]MCL1110716.1 phosphoenolpyruvate--protein phosphotransferase [Shewanella schlegeliana]GIU22662.1 phosphoenolpyruvate--protein phosphotransferase [Shewanella schlegeliana]
MLKTLRDITQAVASARDLQYALELLVTRTKQAMMTECCSIYIIEEQHLILSATDGLDPSAVNRVKLPVTQGLVGLVAQREEAINLADAASHPRFKLLPEVAEEAYSAFLAVPIVYQKSVIGVIVVQQVQARQFSEGEEAFLMTLAAQLAVAIKGLTHKVKSGDSLQQRYYTGTQASKGIAIAKALVLGGQISFDLVEQQTQSTAGEELRLQEAMSRCKDLLVGLSQRFDREKDEEAASIFNALLLLLEKSSLGGEYIKEVRAGWCAETAVCRVSKRYIEHFEAMSDLYLKERASDIRDLGQRVLRQLIEPNKIFLEPETPVILIAREASTTLLAEFPRQKLAGIVTEFGGANSHASILARAMGVPAIIGVDGILSANIEQSLLIINANRGQVIIEPSAIVLSEYQSLIAAQEEQQRQYAQELSFKTVTQDGKRIYLYINSGLLSSVDSETGSDSDGIGLYRTEILFMIKQCFPGEIEQLEIYRKVLKAAGDKPVVMRTLDVGGDKPLDYFPIVEDNPFLGWRGIRLSLDHPELFLIQLRAMLQAAIGSEQLHVLLPMVSNLEEVDLALIYLDQACQELTAELGKTVTMPKVGIMLEVPVLLYQLDEVAKRVDFVSVGSNDLTQYLLAVDRNNPSVSPLFDSYHPGVLRALKFAVERCNEYQLPISVCGELAGEPIGAILLIAMGYDQLSMNQASLARINYLLRRVSQTELNQLLAQALKLNSGEEVRLLVGQYCEQKGLTSVLS